MGSMSMCVGVARFLLLPPGLSTAAIGGIAYATFPPAVIVDHIMMQEGLQNLLFAGRPAGYCLKPTQRI